MGKNLFNKAAATFGYYISEGGVVTYAGSDTNQSEYSALIPVTAGEKYTLSGYSLRSNYKRIHGYDSHGDWTSQLASVYTDSAAGTYSLTATVPTGTAYVRISHFADDKQVQFEHGATATSYEPYSDDLPTPADPGENARITPSNMLYFMQILKRDYGRVKAPYTEVEWVESNGTQYIYLDWKPKIATWGFYIDFISKNSVGTTVGAWNPSTNANGYGSIFGERNSSAVNQCVLSSYSNGVLRIGAGNVNNHGFKTDKTRQQMSLIGTTLTKPNGTTMTVTRASEASGKPYCNMTVFAMHDGLRKSGTGSFVEPSTTRIYSLKFYDETNLEVDLVGAIRNKDGATGLYDKVSGHFYPSPSKLQCGPAVGGIGKSDSLSEATAKSTLMTFVDNRTNSRMLKLYMPELEKLEDGQKITVMYSTAIGASVQTAELAGWDETTSTYNVYIKITLADGSQTDWIPCWYTIGTRMTTHYNNNVPLTLTYRENVMYNQTTTSSGTGIARGFFADPSYDSNTTADAFSASVIAGKNGIKRYTLCMQDDEGNWTSVTTTANSYAATGHVAYTGGLKLGKVLYHSGSADYAAGANSSTMNQTYPGFDLRYSVNGIVNAATTELQFRKPVYLVGTIGGDGLYYLDTTKWWTQDTFVTGKVYVLVGWAYNSYYAIYLAACNLAYYYDGTSLVSYIPAHASTTTTYGAASTSNYGHAKLSSATNSDSEALAATPKAVKAAYDLANGASTTAGQALSAATGSLIFDWTYAITNGNIVCTAHVYQSGTEITSTFDAGCFVWTYRINTTGTPAYISLGTGLSVTLALSVLGMGGYIKCDFTPA